MPQALGLVETKGLVGAIVAADAMAKAANVTIIGKEKVDPALITIKIIGETAAVKSALEAGAAAVQRVGQLISTHLIPNPDVQLGIFFPEILSKPIEEISTSESSVSFKEEKISLNSSEPQSKLIPKKEKKISKVETQQESVANVFDKVQESLPSKAASLFDEVVNLESKPSGGSTVERLKAEALKDLYSEEVGSDEKTKEEETANVKERDDVTDSSFSFEDLESFNVHQLRKLARGVEMFPIHGREISRANRETLLAYFNSLLK